MQLMMAWFRKTLLLVMLLVVYVILKVPYIILVKGSSVVVTAQPLIDTILHCMRAKIPYTNSL